MTLQPGSGKKKKGDKAKAAAAAVSFATQVVGGS